MIVTVFYSTNGSFQVGGYAPKYAQFIISQQKL